MHTKDESAQAVPLVALLIVIAAITLITIGEVGRLLVDRGRARAAADASALAAVHGGRAEAESIARANHAELVDYREGSGWVEVRVRVNRARAVARAAPEVVTPTSPAPLPSRTQGYARTDVGSGS